MGGATARPHLWPPSSPNFRNSNLEVCVCSTIHGLISVIGSISGYRGDASMTKTGQRSKHERGRSKQTAAQLSWLFICSLRLVNVLVNRLQMRRHRLRREADKSLNACRRRRKPTFKELRLISSTSELMLTSAFCFQTGVFVFKLAADTADVPSHALRSFSP